MMESKGWTQKQWAEAANVQPPSLSDYLLGKYPPTLPVLMRLLDAGDWSLADLSAAMDGSETALAARIEEHGGWMKSDPNDVAELVEAVVFRLTDEAIGGLERRLARLEGEVRKLVVAMEADHSEKNGGRTDGHDDKGHQRRGSLPPYRRGERHSSAVAHS